jgi:hypothetical protein
MVLRSTFTRVLAAALLFGFSACAAAPLDKKIPGGPIDQGPGSVAAARRYLEGHWTLQSFEVHPPGKAPIMLKGAGTLTYDAFSNLTMEIRAADKATTDLLRAAGVDITDEGVISTSGRAAVDMPNRTLTYTLEGTPAPSDSLLATNRPRHWQVEGNVLTLTTKDAAGAPVTVSQWKKVS